MTDKKFESSSGMFRSCFLLFAHRRPPLANPILSLFLICLSIPDNFQPQTCLRLPTPKAGPWLIILARGYRHGVNLGDEQNSIQRY